MNDFEEFFAEKIVDIVPKYEKIEVRANISDNGYSIEFFATVDGVRTQCFDMIDSGKIKEKDFNSFSETIVDYARKCPEYKNGTINKYKFVINS